MMYFVMTLPRSDQDASTMLNTYASGGWRVVAAGSDHDGVLTVIMARDSNPSWTEEIEATLGDKRKTETPT